VLFDILWCCVTVLFHFNLKRLHCNKYLVSCTSLHEMAAVHDTGRRGVRKKKRQKKTERERERERERDGWLSFGVIGQDHTRWRGGSEFEPLPSGFATRHIVRQTVSDVKPCCRLSSVDTSLITLTQRLRLVLLLSRVICYSSTRSSI